MTENNQIFTKEQLAIIRGFQRTTNTRAEDINKKISKLTKILVCLLISNVMLMICVIIEFFLFFK